MIANVRATMPHPFDEIGAATNLFIDSRWQRKNTLWLRLVQPFKKHIYRDFRICRVFRFPEGCYVVIKLSRHWAREQQTSPTILAVVDTTRVRTLSSDEFKDIAFRLGLDDNLDKIDGKEQSDDVKAAYELLMRRDAIKCFGEFREWGRLEDVARAGITNGASKLGITAGTHDTLSISWRDFTPGDRELVRLEDKNGCETPILMILDSFQDSTPGEFKVFTPRPEFVDDDLPPFIVAKMVGKDTIRILTVDELAAVSPLYLDSIEQL